jgi:hypothetical protein
MLEQALQGARLLFAYTIFIEAPVRDVFKFTAEPEYWTRDFDGERLPDISLIWEGKEYKPGSVMVLAPLRKDGTPTTVGSVRMELLRYARDEELSFRFLGGNHLVYRFVYEQAGPNRTEFTVNVLVDAQSPYMNTLRQRLYANRRRKESIKNHLRAKANIEARFHRKRSA